MTPRPRALPVSLLLAVALARVAAPAQAGGAGGVPDPASVVTLRLAVDPPSLAPGKPFGLTLAAQVKPGWHVNSNRPKEDWLIPTEASFSPAAGLSIGKPVHPSGVDRAFAFSDKPLSVYEGIVTVTASGSVDASASPGPRVIRATLEFQPCNDLQCLAPASATTTLKVDVAVAAPIGVAPAPAGPSAAPAAAPALASGTAAEPVSGVSAASTASAATAAGSDDPFSGKSLPLLLGIVFLSGLALNLTPCVYPLIPITVSYFGRQSEGKGPRTFGLALSYVLGMSVTYSALGVFAAFSGSLFGAWLQKPAVLVGIALVVLALSLSMFGLYEIQAPHFITDRTGSKSGPLGAFTMGLFVGFVAAPCIGPFVLSLLTYVAAKGSAPLGFGLFFTLAMGLGLPYLVLGTATSSLGKLPRSGEWMVAVRKVFGFVLVALAVWFLRPLLPAKAFGYLLAAPLLAGAAWFAFFERAGAGLSWFRILRGVFALLLLAAALVLGGPRPGGAGRLVFAPYSDPAVAAAKASGRKVMISFAADWCLPCKEIEERTFPDPRVRAALDGWVLLKADVTKATPENVALQERWNIRGVPTLIFLRGDGTEAGPRGIGFEPPEEFVKRLK